MIYLIAAALILGGFRLGMYLGELQYTADVRSANNPRFDAILNERPI